MTLLPPVSVFEDGFVPPAHDLVEFTYTERELMRVLHQQLVGRGWAVLREVPAAPVEQSGRLISRRADVVALRPSPDGIRVCVIEAKRTRQDYLSDVRNPAKQAPWREIAHLHYYAAPEGLVPADSLPEGSGLLEVTRRRHTLGKDYDDLVETVASPESAGGVPDWLVAFMAQQLTAVDGHVNAWSADSTEQERDTASARDLLSRVEVAEAAAARAASVAAAWRALAVTQGYHLACPHCGEAIVPSRVSAGAFTQWRHLRPAPESGCPGYTLGIRPPELEGPP